MTDTPWAQCLGIFAKETGIDVDDLDEEDEFATDLGVNPMVSQTIRANLQAILKTEIPATIFDQCPTVGSFHQYLESLPVAAAGGAGKGEAATQASSPAAPRSSPRVPLSIILQGNPSAAAKTIFLLPDGSGSGMAYMRIPPISPSTCLVALNSPYLDRAADYRCTIEEIAAQWIDEIRRRQSKGPYILGGWSAGGYYSYEVTKALIRAGERVSSLVLLDSPCRPEFEALPMEVVEYLSANRLMGNFTADGAPAWLVEHFRSTIRSVRQYVPEPLEATDVPDVYIVWAHDGVLHRSQLEQTGLDLRVKVSLFLLEGKPHFGPHGWDRLFPQGKLRIATISGNHFTLINPPHVDEIGMLLRDVVTEDIEQRQGDWKTFGGTR